MEQLQNQCSPLTFQYHTNTLFHLNLALQIVAVLRVCSRPFMPFTSDKLSNLLNLPNLEEKGELQEIMELLANGGCLIEPNHQINEASKKTA